MTAHDDNASSDGLNMEPFATTHWSIVLAAGQENSQAIEAMEKLCRAYWYPLYAFCRRMGHSPHDAQDLTQSFFLQLLESELVTKASPQKGRFRSFLLACFKHFIFSEQDRARAQKRGGGQKILSLDQQTAEGKFANEPQDPFDPETQFERAWAYTVVEKALALMEEDYATPEKRLLLDNLKGFIVGGTSSSTYAQIAERLSTSEAAVKMMVQRLRQRYRNCLRRVVAETVPTSSEIDEELRHLVRILGG